MSSVLNPFSSTVGLGFKLFFSTIWASFAFQCQVLPFLLPSSFFLLPSSFFLPCWVQFCPSRLGVGLPFSLFRRGFAPLFLSVGLHFVPTINIQLQIISNRDQQNLTMLIPELAQDNSFIVGLEMRWKLWFFKF